MDTEIKYDLEYYVRIFLEQYDYPYCDAWGPEGNLAIFCAQASDVTMSNSSKISSILRGDEYRTIHDEFERFVFISERRLHFTNTFIEYLRGKRLWGFHGTHRIETNYSTALMVENLITGN